MGAAPGQARFEPRTRSPVHEAVVIVRRLRIGIDTEELRGALLSDILSEEAAPAEEDEYGRRLVLDFEMGTRKGNATVRSGWIVRAGADFPTFTSCCMLQEGQEGHESRRGHPGRGGS